MSGATPSHRWDGPASSRLEEGRSMALRLGIDIACRAAHQASLADETGNFVFTGRRFRTRADELEQLWAALPARTEPADVTVVMEPTRNAWVPLTAWFRRRGAHVVIVPPERSADLRAYFSKHAKSDRLDSRMLARLPMLHPEGLNEEQGLGPGEPIRRMTTLRSNLVKRRSACLARLDALLEILGPGWSAVFRADLSNTTPLRFLAAGYACPHTVRRLGKARITRFIYRHSRGRWGAPQADALLAAAAETLALWNGELDYTELAEDIAIEARLALRLAEEIKGLEERIGILFEEADPAGISTSVPGVGKILGAQILGRLGDPSRFSSLAGVRSYSGLVPSLDASGLSGRSGEPTKRGDACLREALFMAADHARRVDPTLARRYQRLMTEGGKHHNSAICSIASTLLTRLVACLRSGELYVIRDVDGTVLDAAKAKAIVAERYTVPPAVREHRRSSSVHLRHQGTSRRSKESQSAPSPDSSLTHATAGRT